MKRQIIDCCALLNLYTGWGSLQPLLSFELSLYVAKAVIEESLYINEWDSNQEKVKVPIDLRSIREDSNLTVVAPQTIAEIDDYIDFAMEIDDGEAQSLSIAKHRNLVLLTDDRKALALARRTDVSVETLTTVEILQEWGGTSIEHAQSLPTILRRITELARFTPRGGTPERIWWDGLIER